ncbi:MAG: hypothetical protein ABSH44_04960 [Bryobacteraceae bacterium]|jgi:hypothetical protein
MRERERQDYRPPAGEGGGGASGGGGLDRLREQANRFLEAGDEAINRALANSDSEAFLRASRQQGGE